MKPTYELTYLIEPIMGKEDALSFHEKIKEMIKKEGGEPGHEQAPVLKKLAFEIEKHNEGYLASIDFQAPGEKANKIRKDTEQKQEVMRCLLIEKEISNKKEYRKERPKKKTLKPEKAKLKELDKKIDEIL